MKKYIFLFLFLVACQSQNENTTSQNTAKSTENKEDTRKTILFFGNSLTAGFGLELSEAFPALIQKKIDEKGLPYKTINAGLSGETTAAGKNRVDWLLKQPVHVFVLELGANDGLRGLTLSETKQNLEEIIKKVKAKNPDVKVVLAGMQVPPNMGERYTNEFRSIFPQLAHSQQAVLIPFLLQGVAGEPSLNLADGIHPTAQGHQIVAETVWTYLEKIL